MTRYEEVREHLKSKKYTWLITGVAGFIGSNLLENLLALNQRVIGLDNFATGYQHNIDQAISGARNIAGEDVISDFQFINGDIRSLEDCKKACNGVDYVLHQAALGSVPRSIEDPIRTNQTNLDGFLNMLIASRDSKVERFVYAASSSTYGDHPGLPKVEDKIGRPLSPYAVTKFANELYADVFSKVYGVDAIGLRYFNIFGKRQDPSGDYAAVIPRWIGNILNNREVFINGDGETSRDFCYIDNAVQMNLLAATTRNGSAINQVYNVAHNERTSLNQLFSMIQSGLERRVNSLENRQPVYRDFRAGDIRHSQADISKSINLLGYESIQNMSQGLDSSMDWYIANL